MEEKILAAIEASILKAFSKVNVERAISFGVQEAFRNNLREDLWLAMDERGLGHYEKAITKGIVQRMYADASCGGEAVGHYEEAIRQGTQDAMEHQKRT